MKSKASNKILSLALAATLVLGMAVVGVPPLGMTASAAMPSSAIGEPWDGVDFSDESGLLVPGTGIYYGKFDHAQNLQSQGQGYKFGAVTSYEGSEMPILWEAIGEDEDSGNLTVVSKYVLDSRRILPTISSPDGTRANIWEISDLRAWLNNGVFEANTINGNPFNSVTSHDYNNDGFLTSFNERELDLIEDTVVTTGLYTNNTTEYNTDSERTTTDKIYLPWGTYNSGSSSNKNKTWWNADDNVMSATNIITNIKTTLKNTNIVSAWWTRSAASHDSGSGISVAMDIFGNNPNVGYTRIDSYMGVRPAFQFNPSSIIFSSEIADVAVEANGETPSDGNYSSIADGGGGANFKLTIVNSGLTLSSLTGPNSQPLTGNGSETLTVTPGGTIDLTGNVNGATKMAYKIVDRSTGKIVGYGAGTDTTNLTVNGIANMTTGSGNLTENGDYTLYVWAHQDYEKNSNEGSEPMYFALDVQAADTTLPTVTAYSPQNNATNVSTGASLMLTFSENITAVSSKYITIHNDTDSSSEQIEATDAQISSNIVTITPASGLEPGKSYHVTIDAGAFKDGASNNYAGISDAVTWAFSTADAAQGASLSLDYMADDTATEDEPYYKTIPVTYTNGAGTLTYGISGEPSGLSVVSPLGSSGYITGMPDTDTSLSSPYTITVTVTDSMGTSDSGSYTLTVQAAPGSGATLDFATPTDATATVGEPFVKTLSVTYTGSGTLTYSASGLPPGLDIDTNTGKISGTPTQDGDYNVTVVVTDGTLSDDVDFTIEVLPGQQPPVTYHTVIFNPNGGIRTGGGELTQTVPDGGAATAPMVTRNGYTFIGWDKDFSSVSANVTVTAQWERIVTSGSGSSGSGSGSSTLIP